MSKKPKILIFILTYNAADHISKVIDRIPNIFWQKGSYQTDVIIIDDASEDNTAEIARKHSKKTGKNILILENPVNQGYGGNQKIGYTYAIDQKYDAVAMLHGDGQYAPESLEEVLSPILNKEADAVFGSRMLEKQSARKGGMPAYKFIGNKILTKIQNKLLGTQLSEFHSGYRAYSVFTLRNIPFAYNSDDFDFDTDIIIQLIDNGLRIAEVPVPTFYGNETCHVNGFKYSWQILCSTLLSRVQPLGIYYNPKFDYNPNVVVYRPKLDYPSGHSFALENITPGSKVLDIGCKCPELVYKLRENGCEIHGLCSPSNPRVMEFAAYYDKADIVDLDGNKLRNHIFFSENPDYILILDTIEKRNSPENFMAIIREACGNNSPKIIITAGNISFFIVRLSFLFGAFNYGKRGILGLSHKRLFTFYSLRRLLKNEGYLIDNIVGIPVPAQFIFKNKLLIRLVIKINQLMISLRKTFFAFQIGIITVPTLPLKNRLEQTNSTPKDS